MTGQRVSCEILTKFKDYTSICDGRAHYEIPNNRISKGTVLPGSPMYPNCLCTCVIHAPEHLLIPRETLLRHHRDAHP